VLDAVLGRDGDNALNFGAIASSSGIEGIVFDARTGIVRYKHGSGEKQNVGTVMNVQTLQASSFEDEITLHSDSPTGFTVIKSKGLATYKIDISLLSADNDTRYFTIIDSSLPLSSSDRRTPILELINFEDNAKANDIQYREEGIIVYGARTKESNNSDDEGKSTERQAVDEGECHGETGGNPVMGPSDKERLAIIKLVYNKTRPIKIKATSSNGICIMQPRIQQELDAHFFQGKRLHVDFSKDRYDDKSEVDDYAVLKCPTNKIDKPTIIDLGDGENDYLVIGEHLFRDPCGIGSSDTTMELHQDRISLNTWYLVLVGPDLEEKFTEEARRITLIGVEKILSEHGVVVLSLPDSPTNQLKQRYVEVERNDIRKLAKTLAKEVGDNILACIDNTGDLSQEEREELCDQGNEDENVDQVVEESVDEDVNVG
jgi:hypothetical protein